MTRRLQFLFLFVFMLGALPAFSQRIVGYMPSYRDPNNPNIRWNCLTDVCYSFGIIDASGNITIQNTAYFGVVKGFCKPINSSGGNLWLSIGGAGQSGNFNAVATNTTALNNFVSQCVSLCTTHNMVGIDVDWEFPTTAQTGNHQALMSALTTALHAMSPARKSSMAVGGEYNSGLSSPNHLDYVTAATLQLVDYTHVMTYDLPANYNADHSALSDAQGAANQFKAKGGASFPWSKINIGIPFYGRNASRSAVQDYNVEGNFSTAYASGLASGYYYNSKTTMENKVDWIMGQGGAGVIIWDIGTDRASPYNYEDAICARMVIACAAPTPNLGGDKGICGSGNVLLDSGVPTFAGRTFAWTKDGVTISGATSPTYTASAAGLYRVTVSQGSCSRFNEASVIVANSVAINTIAPICNSGTSTITVSSSGGPFQWYDAATNGSLLNTGTSFTTPTLTGTTSYYVQEATGSVTNYTGKAAMNVPNAQPEFSSEANPGTKPQHAHKVVVSKALTIDQVTIYTTGVARTGAKIMVYDNVSGAVVAQSAAVNIPTMTAGTAFTINCALALSPGTYFIGIYVPNTSTGNATVWQEASYSGPAFSIASTISIEANCYSGNFLVASPGPNYGQLFNWKISTGVPNPCPRTTATVTVNPTVTPAVNITANPGTSICSGATVTFTATPTNGGTTPSYQWKVAGVNAGTNSPTFTTTTLTNGQAVTCVMTPNISCPSPATATSNTLTMTVSGAITPSVSITASPSNTICAGATVNFTATPTSGGTTPIYQWKVAGVNAGTNSPTFSSSALTNGQTVTVDLTSNAACTSTTPVTSNTITMTVNAAVTPAVNITASPSTTICAGATVNFTATPTSGGTTPAYQWKVAGVNAGTNSPTFSSSALTNGQAVTCVLTSNAACASPLTATSNTLTMTVNAAATPSVSITASPSNTICAGATVNFTATPTSGGTTPIYQWKVAGVNAGTNSPTFSSSALTNGQTVTVDLTSNAACTSTTPVTSNTITMTVNAAVTPAVNITASPSTTICAGATVNFTATPTSGGTTPAYQWKVAGVNAGTNSPTFSSSALTNGQAVTCVLTSNAACASPLTATSNTLTMTVNAAATPSVSITASPSNTICAGATVNFTATPTSGGTTPIYQWKVAGVNAGTNSPTFSSSALTNGQTVTVDLTSNAACTSTTPVTSNTITMTVNAAVTPAVNITASPSTTICAGATVNFTATPTSGGTTPAYQWKVAGVNAGTNSPTFSSSALTNGQAVTCVLTSNAACASPLTATSNTLTMTVNAAVTPAVTITASPSTTICAGTTVNFTATPTSGGTTPIYQWKLNGGNVGTNSTTYSNATLANGDQVTVTLTSNAACASPLTATSNTQTITITTAVVPSVAITASPSTTICAGATVNFTATPSNGGTTPIYQWKVSGVNAGTNSPTFSSSALTNGQTVTVDITSNAACASTTPVTSNTLTMTVNAAVTPAVNITASPSTTICAGATVNFTATPTSGGTTPAYQWKVAGVNAGTNSPTFSSSALTNGQAVTCVLTSNAACASPLTATSNTLTMTVNAAVTPAVNITASPSTTICAGATVSFTATPTSGGTTPIYQWKVSGVNAGTNSPIFSSSALTNGQTVTVDLTSNAACASTTPVTSNTLTMTVNAAVTPAVSITASPSTTICAGTTVNFTATPTSGGTTPIYQWKLNGGNVGTNSTTYSNATLANGDQVTVTLTSNAACASTTPVTSNTQTITITTAVVPSVAITASPSTTICAGATVNFTATPSNGGTTPIYQWKVSGVNAGTNAPTFSSSALTNGQTVTVTMTSNAACASTTPVTSNTLTMTVNAAVTPSVAITASPSTTICAGATVNFTATPTSGGTTPIYQWKVSGVNAGTNSPIFSSSALTNGQTVTVDLTSNAACASTTPVTSNTQTMTVNAAVTPAVAITASPSTTICAGATVSFTATPTSGGTTPIYQWKVSGVNAGTNSPIFSSSALTNGQTVTVDLTSNAACASTTPVTSNTLTMTVNAAVTPAVSISASPSTTICAGTTVNFTATPTSGGTTPIYQWKLNGGNVGTNSTTYSNATLANGDQVTVTLTSNAACASTTPVTSNTQTITITTAVVPSVAITASPSTTICAGATVNFTATPSNGGTTPIYQWKVSGVNAGTNAPTFSSSALTNGQTVTVTMTSNAACASTTPVTSNTQTMTVNAAVTPAVAITASPSTTICAGATVSFTATPTSGGTTPIYQWKVSGVNAGTNSPIFSSSALTNGQTVTVDLTSNAACASTTPVTSNTLTMTVNAAVTPAVSISASPSTTICAGTTVNFTATPTSGGTTPIYQWKLNGGNVGTNSTTYSNATLANGDQVTVTLTSNAACASTTPVTSNTQTITITTAVVPSVTISASPSTTICAGTTVNFTATPSNGGTTPIYQWKLNGGNVGTNSTTYSNATLANGDQVTVTMTSNAACASTTPVTSNTQTITITTAVVPSVTISASPSTTICAGTLINFTATPSNGGTTPIYQWKLNGGNVGTNSTTYSNATLANGDQVTVTMTSNASCASTTPVTSNTQTITITTAVTPSVSISASPSTTICAGTTVNFTATPSNGGTTPIYQWKLNGGNVGTNSTTYSNASLINGDQVTLTMTSNAACASTTPVTSNTIGMTVGTTPTSAGAIGGTFTVSPGQSGVAYSVTNIAGTTYNWTYSGTGYTINGSGSSITIDYSSTATGGILSVTATTTCGTSPASTQTITVGSSGITPQPGNFLTSSSSVCQGTSGVAYSVPNVPGTAYTWTFGGTGYTINGTGSAITMDFSTLATGDTLKVVANNGNGNSIPRFIVITVNAIATQPISIFGSTTATQGQSNVAYFVPPQTGVTFNWTYTGTGMTVVTGQGANAITVNYSSTATSGDIEVVASSSACPSTSLPTALTITVSPSTGIEDGLDLEAYGLKVYPNPASSTITVEVNVKNVGSKLNLSLYDMLGNEVRVLLENASVISDSYTFSLEGLAYGVYFVKAKSGDDVKTIKLIKY